MHTFRDGLMSVAQNENRITSNQRLQQRSIRFIPYPYKTLGSGSSLQCQWETRPLPNSNTSNVAYLDFTQQNAYTQGICIPPTLNGTLHIFSSEEAIECLSSQVQNRNIKLMISGDSYMKQLTIGLADILLSKHIRDDKELLAAGPRDEVLSVAHGEMEKRRNEEVNPTFPFVRYVGQQCYGNTPLSTICTDMIDQLGGDNSTEYVWIIGTAVHIYLRHVNATNPVRATIDEISNYLDTTKRILYVSPPFYYPDQRFTDQLVRDQAEIYTGLLPNRAPENAAHPFLDVYELTRSCQWENCSYDRAHRSRFVNRWKAQLLLNTLCEVEVQRESSH